MFTTPTESPDYNLADAKIDVMSTASKEFLKQATDKLYNEFSPVEIAAIIKELVKATVLYLKHTYNTEQGRIELNQKINADLLNHINSLQKIDQ